jgi:hypothetical protein
MNTGKDTGKAEFEVDGASVLQYASQPFEPPHAAGAEAAYASSHRTSA